MAAPGWYPVDGKMRYWDGQAWAEESVEQTSFLAPVPVPQASAGGRTAGSTWWKSKPAVGAGGILLGLILGAAGTAGSADSGDSEDLRQQVSSLRSSNEDLQSNIRSIEDSAGADDAEVQDQVAGAVADANAAAKLAQEEAVAKAVAAERAKADRRVAKAKSDAIKLAESSSDDSDADSGTDPQFDTCGDANDAGYGPYTEGVDPEYDWYQDRDSDGVVCEF